MPRQRRPEDSDLDPREQELADNRPVRDALNQLRIPEGRALGPGALDRLLVEVTDQRSLLPHLAAFHEEGRREELLHQDERLDVWLVRWQPGHVSGRWHDHDTSVGALRVLKGELVEHTLGLTWGDVRVRLPMGFGYRFNAEHLHRLDASVPDTVALHGFSPPLRRPAGYVVADGVLRRVRINDMPYCGSGSLSER